MSQLQIQKMMQYRQSRMDPAGPNVLLSPKSTSILDTWNVRTMYQARISTTIANEMKRYKISVLGISETRWTSLGEMKLAENGKMVIPKVSEKENAPRTPEGVMLKQR